MSIQRGEEVLVRVARPLARRPRISILTLPWTARHVGVRYRVQELLLTLLTSPFEDEHLLSARNDSSSYAISIINGFSS